MTAAVGYTEPRFAPLPPTSFTRPTVDWMAHIPALKARPGEWAALGTIPNSQSLGRRAQTMRNHGIEVTTRGNGDGTRTVWACYQGGTIAPTCPPLEVPAEAMAAWFGSEAA